MRVSEIKNINAQKAFKGYHQEINKYGENVYRVNAPFDPESQELHVVLYSAHKNDAGTDLIPDKQIYAGQVPQGGLVLDYDEMEDYIPGSDILCKKYIKQKGEI